MASLDLFCKILKKWSGVILAVALAALVYLVPIAGIDGQARMTLSLLMLAAVLWISKAIPLHATAFVIVIVTVIFGIHTPKEALAPFFHPVIALLLGGFILSVAVEKYGLGDRVSIYILTHTGTKPKNVLFGVMATTAFLSLWMSNTATTAVMLVAIMPILSKIPKGDPFSKAMILGIPFAANVGGIGTPVGTPPNPIAISYLAQIGMEVSFSDWMMFALPIMLLFLVLIWKILLLLFKPKIKCFSAAEMEITAADHGGRFGTKEKLVLGIFLSTVILWLTESIHGVSTSIVALIPVVLFLSTGLLDHDDFNRTPWEILLLIGGGLSLSNAIHASGLGLWLIGQIDVIGLPVQAITFLFTGTCILMTTFMSNTATAALTIPIIGEIGYGLGAEVAAIIVISITIGTSMAMALPISTAPNAIAYGTGKIEMKDMIKAGVVISVSALALISTIGYLWLRFIL